MDTQEILVEATRRTLAMQGIPEAEARERAAILDPPEAMAAIGLDADLFAEWALVQVHEMSRVTGLALVVDPWWFLVGVLASGVHLGYQVALMREETGEL